MIPATIRGASCNTIKDFYAIRVPKIKYSASKKPIHTVADFFSEFLIDANRLPSRNVVEAWHELLVWYINQPDAPLFVRKYEAKKEKGQWDNRRGCVLQFEDGFEIVYASNFLAHDIFLMAYHGFVPSKADFMEMAKSRQLPITSGTKIEKEIRTYPPANKGLSYCYLAHIMDVNGQYVRDDGSYRRLSDSETACIFPSGKASSWISSADKIWHIPYALSDSEKDLVKAHCLRFLDPMNYYLTPLTGHCTHMIPGFKKNIGEYMPLTYYVQQQYRHFFGSKYDDLLTRARFMETPPRHYTGREVIDLEYSSDKDDRASKAKTDYADELTFKATSSLGRIMSSEHDEFINELGDFMRNKSHLAERSVRIYLGKIVKLLEQDYSVNDLCGGIDEIVAQHQKGGQYYDPADSGNTSAALGQVKQMLRYPYICYNLYYQSFPVMGEHVSGYCIDGNTITISKKKGFCHLGDVVKRIPKTDYKKLITILEQAKNYNVFAKSNTSITTAHGTAFSYDYCYGQQCGNNCISLFKSNSGVAARLEDDFADLIAKLTK